MVLLYTLKKHKQKLKKRGLGPFVVSELNTSGAVRLETIDGEPMENFINGSSLKQYEESLTEDMLVCLHAAQTRKEGQALLRHQAREEADTRVAQAKARRKATVLEIQMTDDEDYVEPPFHIKVDMNTQTTSYIASALIDLGADCNV